MKNKIIKNRPPVSSEEIASRKNFNMLMKKYPHMLNPLRKTPWSFKAMLWVAAASAGLVYYVMSRDVTPEPFVKAPLPGITIPYTKFTVAASEGGEFNYVSGTKIIVPENSFLDQQGNLVGGDVELVYREFRDPLDFFLSGIPMQYDSAGVKYEFESGGMFEINAFRDGLPLKVNPVNPIQVRLASEDCTRNFNQYYLDTLARNWVYKGKTDITQAEDSSRNMVGWPDSTRTIESTEKEWKDAQKKVVALEKHKPFVPKRLDESKYNFNIAADPDEFPELALYKGLRFQVSDENKDFTSAMYKIVWEDVVIKENMPGVNYKVILKKGETEQTVIVFPVFNTQNYENAMKQFESKFKKYNELLTDRKTEEKRAYEVYLAQKERNDAQLAKNTVNLMTSNVLQTLTVDGFGFWNSDWPFILPKGALLMLLLADEQGEPINNPKCYLVDKEMNAIFYYHTKTLKRFEFNPESDNVMWAVGEKGMYVFTREDFKKVDAVFGEYTFTVKKIDPNIKSKEALKTALGM